ncbi:hypothetical protein ACU01Y_003780 [Salmonella enterica subsp. enterica serovar Newport]
MIKYLPLLLLIVIVSCSSVHRETQQGLSISGETRSGEKWQYSFKKQCILKMYAVKNPYPVIHISQLNTPDCAIKLDNYMANSIGKKMKASFSRRVISTSSIMSRFHSADFYLVLDNESFTKEIISHYE